MFEEFMKDRLLKKGYRVTSRSRRRDDKPLKRAVFGSLAGAVLGYCMNPRVLDSLYEASPQLSEYLVELAGKFDPESDPPQWCGEGKMGS